MQMRKKVHFIGVGGIGISALAKAYLNEGYIVQGSDISKAIAYLEPLGIKVFYGHNKNNISKDISKVIYTEAINSDNPELVSARKLGLDCVTYFEELGRYTKDKYLIAVSGTHGKTTTTAMIALCLINGGFDPSVIIGSKMKEIGDTNYRYGKTDIFVVEACEYRESFLGLEPNILVVTNIELDHLDYYRSESHYISAFVKLAKKIPRDGFLVINKKYLEIFKDIVQCSIIEIDESYNPVLQIPGQHNIENARHACTVSKILGIETPDNYLNKFTGTWRRFEILGEKKGVLVIDDYAHHPTEIEATLKSIKQKYPGRRVVCVFQPHQYSRTYRLDFSGSFIDADIVMVPNIYEARDTKEDKKRITAKQFAETLQPKAIYTRDFSNTVNVLRDILVSNDILVTMGAGDIREVSELILELI